MRRNFHFTGLAVLFLLVMSLFLGACGDDSDDKKTSDTSPTATIQPTSPSKDVVLTMGSWRPDDVEQMNRILAAFHDQYPNITVEFTSINPPEYNEVLETQLKGGTAPDLFYLRSYAVSRGLFEQGFLEPLGDLPGLNENFSPEMRAPWATDDGQPYGVPFIATSHGVYYNQDIFETLNLEIPTTWDDLLAAAQTIKDSGTTPFANASGDTWTMAELVFMNLAPTFIGGREGRMQYLAGERCFNDEGIVAVFDAIQQIALFLPENQGLITYSDSLQLFLQGQAAMWLGGSWDIPFFEAQEPGFAWSVFAIPAPTDDSSYVTFQLDAGMGVNAASPYKAEARIFLEWMTTTEFGALLGDELPGFFPMHTNAPELSDPQANAFLALNEGRGTDVRFTWEKLMEGTPSAYTLVESGTVAVVNGDQTPQQAADALQAGLAEWFEPAKTCMGNE